jgi:hypothetical protein
MSAKRDGDELALIGPLTPQPGGAGGAEGRARRDCRRATRAPRPRAPSKPTRVARRNEHKIAENTSVPLSTVQKGAIGQFAFLAAALASGKGQVEAYTPAVDNEGRDAEIRRHLKSTPAISVQVKVSLSTQTLREVRGKYLSLRFSTVENRVQNDPRLWYFFAFYDPRELRLHDPCFLITARVFHRIGKSGAQFARSVEYPSGRAHKAGKASSRDHR